MPRRIGLSTMPRQFNKLEVTLPWVVTAVTVCAALATVLPSMRLPEPSARFPVADGMTVRAECIDLSPNRKLFLRYSPIADTGVELEVTIHGRRIWSGFVDPLGMAHSAYSHSVECFVGDAVLKIRSKGSGGTIVEDRDTANGKLLSRQVTSATVRDCSSHVVPRNEPGPGAAALGSW